ncbi:MAG: hypothetical protein WBF90_17355 [Rivularia sp. (in: cyanobacteria)]
MKNSPKRSLSSSSASSLYTAWIAVSKAYCKVAIKASLFSIGVCNGSTTKILQVSSTNKLTSVCKST